MTVDHPGCVLFLIDQSYSMAEWSGQYSKAELVANALNRLLSGLVARCRDNGTVRDFLQVGAIGYGGPAPSGLSEHLVRGGRGCQPISRLPAGRPGVLVPGPADGYGRLVKKRPWPLRVWLEPVAEFGTEMCRALRRAAEICRAFVARHPRSYPPIVINLTDGQATDGDPAGPAVELTGVGSAQGTVLLVNLHMSSMGGAPIEFPAEPPGHDPDARVLCGMSSRLPDQMHLAAARLRRPLVPGARGFAYNARADALARLLDIGVPASLLPGRRHHPHPAAP